jgi:hypothetical protein
MEDEQFEKSKRFLDEKKIPTSDDILNLFFNGFEDVDILSKEDIETIDFKTLGEADDIKIITGTEWVASRLIWNTPEGPICSINLIKTENIFLNKKNDIDPFELMKGLYTNKKNFPYDLWNEEITDIDYEDVEPLPFTEQLKLAIEVEAFEEAARLRDWDAGLKILLLKLKPLILDTLSKEDVDVNKLDDYLTQIRDYRKTL